MDGASSMATASLLPLALFVLTSTLTPGGATTLATASGAAFGFRRSLPLLVGLSAGLATLAGMAATGLSGLLLAAPHLQLAMQLAGTAYLFWLAWKLGCGRILVMHAGGAAAAPALWGATGNSVH